MERIIKILLLEDDIRDKELIDHILEGSDLQYSLLHTHTKSEFLSLLKSEKPHVILSDYYLTDFTGLDVLKIINGNNYDIPVILITGSIREEVVIACMKEGAADYIIKESIKRLPYAISEVIKHKTERDEKNRALKQLFESEKKFRFLAERAHDLIYRYVFLPEPRFDFVSPSSEKMTGYTAEEHYSDPYLGFKIVHPEDIPLLQKFFESKIPTDALLLRWIKKDGAVIWIEQHNVGIYDETGKVAAIEGIARDVTEKVIFEEKLKESEKIYRYLFENNPRPMWVYDPHTLKFLAVNDAAVSVYGYSKEEFLKFTLMDIRPSDDEEKLKFNIRTKNEKTQHSGYWRHLTKGGKIKYVDIDSHEISFAGINARLVLVTDVTSRKIIEDKLNLISRAIEQTPVSVIITNRQGKITYVNPKFVDLTGYNMNDLTGKTPAIINSGYHPPEFYSELWRTITGGESWHGEFRNKKKSGELYWENAIISPVKDDDGNITHFIAVKEDITAMKQVLFDLTAAKDRAEEMSRLKTSFLANMSHELRTPMIGILGYSEMISDLSNDPEIKLLSMKMNLSAHRLMETLNLILNLSKLESENNKIDFAPVDVVAVTISTVDDFNSFASQKNLKLSYHSVQPRILINSDERMLRSVIHNLVSNAVKYTDTGYVMISIDTEISNDKEFVLISVVDSGIGIPPEYQDVIFDEFRQVSEGLSRSYEGTGLGLSLAKKITEKLGGSISLKSEPGKGTEFTLRFKV
ncbi:MAG: PAS domain S-box protein [Ignavibacteriaceae bacterium]|nr:PAS domain S-box protein [Ignavibacteriaceae bacterium]